MNRPATSTRTPAPKSSHWCSRVSNCATQRWYLSRTTQAWPAAAIVWCACVRAGSTTMRGRHDGLGKSELERRRYAFVDLVKTCLLRVYGGSRSGLLVLLRADQLSV